MEQRLIDANTLKDAHIECPGNVSFFGFGEMVERFLQTIDEQPTMDAVPVVRCGKCANRKYCEHPQKVDSDWFCADGERRDA